MTEGTTPVYAKAEEALELSELALVGRCRLALKKYKRANVVLLDKANLVLGVFGDEMPDSFSVL